jgi:hypothetical protein
MANPVTRIILSAVDRTKAAFTSVKGGLASIGNSASALTGMLGSLFVGLSVVGFVGKIKQAVNALDEVSKSAQKAGTSTENLSALNFAGDQSGVKDMTKSLVALVDSLDQAKSGTGPAAEAFATLRIDPAQFTDSSDALDAIAERFAVMPDGVDKTALAIDLFGKKIGPELIPLLNQGREGIQALKDEAAALGVVIGGDSARAAEQFNDSLDKLKTASNGLGISIANEMLPGLNQVTDAMVTAAKEAGLLESLWVGLGGLGAALFTDELLTNTQKLAKAQRQLNEALAGGFKEEHEWVRELRLGILVLGNKVAAEEKAAAAERAAANESKKYTADRKANNEELKKSTDEQIKDAERLQSALQSAFSASIKAEEDYLRQAKKLRAEANGTATVGADPESQASATLDATIAAMRLQREAGTANLDSVRDQADALRAMADQLEDVRLKEDLRRMANQAEATALERAAAEERARYEELARQQAESVRQSDNLKAALDGIGKEVSVEVKPGTQMEKTKQDLTEIVHLLEVIKQNGPINVNAAAPAGTDSTAETLRKAALQYGSRN